jgi:hypothetical protein
MPEDDRVKAKAVVMSAAEWRDWPASMKRSYVWGVVDTWSNIPGVSRPVNERRRGATPYVRLAASIGKTITYDELFAMVEKYVADHPAQLNADMTTIIWSAVNKTSQKQ